MSFDNDTRNLLARTVSSARALLTADVQAQLQANYGLYPDGRRLTIARTPTAQQAAAELADLWDHFAANEPANLQSPVPNLPSAYQRLVREIGFTLLNRLAALRLCEERGIVIECVGKGMQSAGFQLYDRLANGALGNRYQTYRAFLEGLFDELALDLGALFARDLPQSHIFPGETTLTDLLALLNEPELARRQVWQSDETIGWIYQYYNDPEERRSMRQASSAPRNSRELAVRNQFFTPRYVVEFLTDNTLGRIWYEMMQGQTALAEECRYLVRRPIELFLDDPDEYLDDNCRPWVRRARQADFSELPDDPTEDELASLSLAFDGYKVAASVGGYGDLLDWATGQIDRFAQGGDLPADPLELWLLLFAMQRSYRMITGSGPAPRDFLALWRNIYLAWRKTVSSEQFSVVREETAEDGEKSSIVNRQSSIAFVPFRAKKDPRQLKILDPAGGSGHFLLYAFDLLLAIYEEAYHDPDQRDLQRDYATLEEVRRAAPELILRHNLHLIDIDGRAAQIAALALWLRAQRAWGEMGLRPTERPRIHQTHIVTAEPMPGDKTLLAEFSRDLRPRVLGQLAAKIFDKMKLAGEAGSLLKIEVELAAEIAAAKKVWLEQGSRAEQLALLPDLRPAKARQMGLFDVRDVSDAEFWQTAETQLLDALRQYAARAGRRRLFAHDAAQGFALIDLCQGQYDVVLMNPPFGEGSAQAKSYVGQAYPISKNDLYAAFVERWLGRLQPNGRLGAITSRTGFFLSSFRRWREEVLLGQAPPVVVADLGYGVLDAAMVETAAYVCSPILQNRATPLLFLRLLEAEDKAAACRAILENRATGAFTVSVASLRQVPGTPFAYWVSDDLRRLFQSLPPFEPTYGEARTGLQSLGADEIFIKTWWEVEPRVIGRSARWVAFAKGGESSRWYGDIHLVTDWENDGKRQKAYALNKYNSITRKITGISRYFTPGLTYTTYTNLGFHVRTMPAECIFSLAGVGIFPDNPQDIWWILALLNSSLLEFSLRLTTDRRKWEPGYVKQLPFRKPDSGTLKLLENHARKCVLISQESFSLDETSRVFKLPGLIKYRSKSLLKASLQLDNEAQSRLSRLTEIEGKLDEVVFDLYQLGKSERALIHSEFVNSSTLSQESASENDEEDHESVNNEDLLDSTSKMILWQLGAAFGRWDIRFAQDPDLLPPIQDPFAPLPQYASSILTNINGLPATSNQIVSKTWLHARRDANSLPPTGSFDGPATIPDEAYPLPIPWDGILVDDPGLEEQAAHPNDIVTCVQHVLALLWPESYTAIEAEACEILGVRSLRDYFRKWSSGGFFDDHLKRYSKSRRKAPIYWPLSTASGRYTLWLYYQRLSDETLYTAVNKYVEPKIQQVERRLVHWEQTIHELGGKPATERRDAITDLRGFLAELRAFRDELLRAAGLPYKPNLNDGVIINAAPLYRMHPHRAWARETAAVWQKLEKGEYDWAHLAYTIWPGRVREVCRKDRSIAIAHGLEGLCGVSVKGEGKGKAAKGRSKKRGAQQAALNLDSDAVFDEEG